VSVQSSEITLAITARPAEVTIKSVRLSPSTVEAGKTFDAYATFENTGSTSASITCRLTINSTVAFSGPVNVPPGVNEVRIGGFSAPSTVGSYNVCIEKVA
jgi:hypothetical protein